MQIINNKIFSNDSVVGYTKTTQTGIRLEITELGQVLQKLSKVALLDIRNTSFEALSSPIRKITYYEYKPEGSKGGEEFYIYLQTTRNHTLRAYVYKNCRNVYTVQITELKQSSPLNPAEWHEVSPARRTYLQDAVQCVKEIQPALLEYYA
jgi:hypothetical protein